MGSLDFSTVLSGNHLDWLLSGLWLTFQLALGSWLLAFVVGLLLTVLRATGFRAAELFVAAYVEIHQNIPLLVQVLFWYFAIPEILPDRMRMWLYENGAEYVLALLAIGFCFAAYMSEALRSGLRAVPRTQYEAGRVFGFGYLATMRYIVVPQAVRVAVPPLVNQTLLLFKNTSLAMVIGVHELTYQARQIENETFRTFEVFAVATAIYLAISFIITGVGSWLERRAAFVSR